MFVLYENESSCWYQFGEMIVKQAALLLVVPGRMQGRGSSRERLRPLCGSPGPWVLPSTCNSVAVVAVEVHKGCLEQVPGKPET